MLPLKLRNHTIEARANQLLDMRTRNIIDHEITICMLYMPFEKLYLEHGNSLDRVI